MSMNLTADERETVITMNDEDDFAMVYTCQNKWMNRMKGKLGLIPIKEDKHDGEVVAEFYQIPKSWIKISKPVKREMTDEQRKESVERLRKGRELKLQEREMAEELSKHIE